ncbi:MAG: hypothetical protein KatS3mg102_2486 [Planctomycetota bacterium]|nr:MAG: hypothetical protein KatS3mg102_2486 [Planctomycetota bacterium]
MKRVALALVLGVAMFATTGCAALWSWPVSSAGPGFLYVNQTLPSEDTTSTVYKFERKDFDILGPVSAEAETSSILGWVATGDGGYNKLLTQAKAQFNADDVINVRIDTSYSNILGIISTAKTKLYGTAIRFKK